MNGMKHGLNIGAACAGVARRLLLGLHIAAEEWML